jgi:hypothetical protein
MDLAERIARRRNRRSDEALVVDLDALNPAVHLPEPVGREALFEALLDALDPVFDGDLPPDAYVWGPVGAGKSAIVSSLVSALDAELSNLQPMYTATRGGPGRSEGRFAYVDAREAASRFQLYRRALDAVRAGSVPSRGVGTDELREELGAELSGDWMVLAVDHLGEPGAVDIESLEEALAPLDRVAWLGVGRAAPEELPAAPPDRQLHVPGYSYELIDVLTIRGARGLSRSLDHAHARRIAEWADGNAHDALAALFVAAARAEEAGAADLRGEHVDAGLAAVPRNGAPIGRALALSDTEQLVLGQLLGLSADGDRCIDDAAAEIAQGSDLTRNTVRRLLYELAQGGILKRLEVTEADSREGRQPSRVAPNFSTELFERLTGR